MLQAARWLQTPAVSFAKNTHFGSYPSADRIVLSTLVCFPLVLVLCCVFGTSSFSKDPLYGGASIQLHLLSCVVTSLVLNWQSDNLYILSAPDIVPSAAVAYLASRELTQSLSRDPNSLQGALLAGVNMTGAVTMVVGATLMIVGATGTSSKFNKVIPDIIVCIFMTCVGLAVFFKAMKIGLPATSSAFSLYELLCFSLPGLLMSGAMIVHKERKLDGLLLPLILFAPILGFILVFWDREAGLALSLESVKAQGLLFWDSRDHNTPEEKIRLPMPMTFLPFTIFADPSIILNLLSIDFIFTVGVCVADAVAKLVVLDASNAMNTNRVYRADREWFMTGLANVLAGSLGGPCSFPALKLVIVNRSILGEDHTHPVYTRAAGFVVACCILLTLTESIRFDFDPHVYFPRFAVSAIMFYAAGGLILEGYRKYQSVTMTNSATSRIERALYFGIVGGFSLYRTSVLITPTIRS